MKDADIKIGGEYLTRVSGELVRVRVQGRLRVLGRLKYTVSTVSELVVLPTPRTAAQLKEAP